MKHSSQHRHSLRALPVAIMLAGLCLLAGCKDDNQNIVSRETDPERVPTMMTRNVETLISDSGIIRYRITTPLWLVFDEAKQPSWKFPNSLHLEKFNDLFQRDASIDCDSATYFTEQDLWRLDGRVYIVNTAGEKFLSEQLYWSNRNHKVYTDSFIHIEQQNRVIEGYGFISNDRMTNYSVNQVSGIFPVSDFRGSGQDSTATDTVQVAAQQPDATQPKADKASVVRSEPQPKVTPRKKVDASKVEPLKIMPHN